jgi:hypothetical protein
LASAEAELRTLKVIDENVVAYFYPQNSDTTSRAPELLDMLPTRSREVITSNMRKASTLTLGILKSLYPKVDIDPAGEGFATTCSKEEATDLVQSFLETATQVIEMILTCHRFSVGCAAHGIIVNNCMYPQIMIFFINSFPCFIMMDESSSNDCPFNIVRACDPTN